MNEYFLLVAYLYLKVQFVSSSHSLLWHSLVIIVVFLRPCEVLQNITTQ